MMGYWWLFLLGLLGGWLIELAIDYTWWRKRHRAAAQETARRLGEIEQLRQELESRQTRLALRERDAGERETVQSGRDADLLLQAKRIDERGEAILRTEQRLDARRAELEHLAVSLGERERASSERLAAVKQAEARFEERQVRLDAADVEAAKREAMLGSRESGIKRWEQRVLMKEKDLHGLEAEAARAARDAERWRRQYHGMRALIDERYRRDDGADDLTVIQGIDPRAESMLNELGITSFARLAETPLGELSRLAEQGGAGLALSDPMSWAEQAALLLDRDFIGFESLKARLRGDVPADEPLAATDIALESGPPLSEAAASEAGSIEGIEAPEVDAPARDGAEAVAAVTAVASSADEASADGALADESSADGVSAEGVAVVPRSEAAVDIDAPDRDGGQHGEALVIGDSVATGSAGNEAGSAVGQGEAVQARLHLDPEPQDRQSGDRADVAPAVAGPRPSTDASNFDEATGVAAGAGADVSDAPDTPGATDPAGATDAPGATSGSAPMAAAGRGRTARSKGRGARGQKPATAGATADPLQDAGQDSTVDSGPGADPAEAGDRHEPEASASAGSRLLSPEADDDAASAEDGNRSREVETIGSTVPGSTTSPESQASRRPEQRGPFAGQPSRGGGRRRRR